MPYAITNESADCSGWATVDPDGDVIGCHQTKAEAIAQAVAVSLATGEEFVGERALPDLGAPEFMRDAARQGVEWFEAGLAGDGVTDETVSEARLMTSGEVSLDKWVRVSAWIARHLVDLDAPGADPDSDEYPSPGVVAHALWGSRGGIEGALRVKDYADRLLNAVEDEAEGDDEDSDTQDMERVSAYRAGKLNDMSEFETREFTNTIELRADGDGNTFSGYAAVFNSPSEPLPFTEVIAPGAFRKSLLSRNDVKLLFNHDSGQVLASTRSGTLKLEEDDRGLKVTATLPDTTTGRDLRELVSKGIIDAMSFGFTVPHRGDSWSSDGKIRTLKSVRLIETSIVAWPAYSATAGTVAVRSFDKLAQRAEVDADALQDVLTRIEAGAESLTAADRALIEKVLDRLAPEAEADEIVGDLDALALKKKKLDLLERF
jgi:HK97 family phage prohead protease